MDNKINDNDVIKLVEHFRNLETDITGMIQTMNQAIDIMNRQQAEIERLKKENAILSTNADNAFQEGLNENREIFKNEVYAEIKSEARKEFAERLCEGRVSNDPVVIAVKVELEMMDGKENGGEK